jgi:glyoxylase-like metal-dependent hydrolase (beta-lactamase superfamily II)
MTGSLRPRVTADAGMIQRLMNSSSMSADFERAGLQVLERSWLSSNNILFAGDAHHEATLVDSGYWSQAEQTVALVRHALGARPLARIVNTHLHSDHCGGNAALQQAYGCAVDVPAGEAEKVDRWDEDALSYRFTGQHCPRFVRHGAIEAGDEIELGPRRWRALASPGHDPESLVLYEPDLQILISADALWENGFGIVFPELDGPGAFEEARATLDMLDGLPLRWVIPGHGRPFDQPALAIRRAQRRLDGLMAEPARHARHAAKVMIKFHLMELQTESLDALAAWLDRNGAVRNVHQRYGDGQPYGTWWRALLGELQANGALLVREAAVENA